MRQVKSSVFGPLREVLTGIRGSFLNDKEFFVLVVLFVTWSGDVFTRAKGDAARSSGGLYHVITAVATAVDHIATPITTLTYLPKPVGNKSRFCKLLRIWQNMTYLLLFSRVQCQFQNLHQKG